MDNNALLIKRLTGKQIIKTPAIADAFFKIDRKHFVAETYTDKAYEDTEIPTEAGQTISKPAVIAFMLELLQPSKGSKVLDVGTGTGWSTALLAHLVGPEGKVDGIEIMPILIEKAINNLNRMHITNAQIHRAGKTLGRPEGAPYDHILVSAYAPEIPHALLDQLKINGTLVMPIKNDIVKITKLDENNLSIKSFPGYMFQPLIIVKSEEND